jgi:hypothetical protein
MANGSLSEKVPDKLTLLFIMKTPHKVNSTCQIETKTLTLGDLIASTYGACGEHGASKILQLAMEAHVIKYPRPR